MFSWLHELLRGEAVGAHEVAGAVASAEGFVHGLPAAHREPVRKQSLILSNLREMMASNLILNMVRVCVVQVLVPHLRQGTW